MASSTLALLISTQATYPTLQHNSTQPTVATKGTDVSLIVYIAVPAAVLIAIVIAVVAFVKVRSLSF